MKRSTTVVAASITIAAMLALTLFIGFRLGRSTLPTIIDRPQLREIISDRNTRLVDNISNSAVGSPHSEGYSLHAFMMVGMQLESILDAVIGNESQQYYAYLIPEPSGFRIVIHHDTLTATMTDSQYNDLMKRVDSALQEETNK
jgi:hypothetical protein